MTSMYCTTELDDVISLLLGCHRKSEIKYREHDGTSLTLKVHQFCQALLEFSNFVFTKKNSKFFQQTQFEFNPQRKGTVIGEF